MEEHTEHKKTITVEVFSQISYKKPFTIGAISKVAILQPDDEILQQWNEAYEGSDSAMDGHWECRVLRDRLETDEEYNKRLESQEKMVAQLKENRRKRYLELKKEFENEE